jgi:hypothetical protein
MGNIGGLMKFFLSALFLLSSFAHASVSCDISFYGKDKLKLTDAEEAKLKLFLSSKQYNLDPKAFYAGMDYGVNFNSIHLSQDQKGLFVVKNLDRPQKVNQIEIPLTKDGEPLKILKPKKTLFGFIHDKGTPGFVLAMGIARDLPKCDENNNIAINDADRETWGKQSAGTGVNLGPIFPQGSLVSGQ